MGDEEPSFGAFGSSVTTAATDHGFGFGRLEVCDVVFKFSITAMGSVWKFVSCFEFSAYCCLIL